MTYRGNLLTIAPRTASYSHQLAACLLHTSRWPSVSRATRVCIACVRLLAWLHHRQRRIQDVCHRRPRLIRRYLRHRHLCSGCPISPIWLVRRILRGVRLTLCQRIDVAVLRLRYDERCRRWLRNEASHSARARRFPRRWTDREWQPWPQAKLAKRTWRRQRADQPLGKRRTDVAGERLLRTRRVACRQQPVHLAQHVQAHFSLRDRAARRLPLLGCGCAILRRVFVGIRHLDQLKEPQKGVLCGRQCHKLMHAWLRLGVFNGGITGERIDKPLRDGLVAALPRLAARLGRLRSPAHIKNQRVAWIP